MPAIPPLLLKKLYVKWEFDIFQVRGKLVTGEV